MSSAITCRVNECLSFTQIICPFTDEYTTYLPACPYIIRNIVLCILAVKCSIYYLFKYIIICIHLHHFPNINNVMGDSRNVILQCLFWVLCCICARAWLYWLASSGLVFSWTLIRNFLNMAILEYISFLIYAYSGQFCFFDTELHIPFFLQR